MPDRPSRLRSPEGRAATVVLAVLICVVLLQVAGRLGWFRPPVWTEELARWLWVWMAFLGMAEVERTGTHLRMDFLPGLLPQTARLLLFTAIDLLWLAATCELLRIGAAGVLRTWNNTAVSLPVSDAVLYASYPVAGLFIALRIVQRLSGHLRALREGR